VVNVHRYQGSGNVRTAHISNLGEHDVFVDSENGITVTAIDVGGQTATVEVSLNGNSPPTADFTHTANGLQVQFTDASSDSDGSIDAHQWRFGDGATSSQADPNHTYAAAGTYTVQLTATDDDGATDTTSKSIAVVPANIPPKADFTFAVDNLNVQFSNASNDSDGTLTEHRWDFGDGAGSDQTDPNYTYTAAGTYSVSLMVTDDDGATDTTSQSVAVATPANNEPQADFEFTAAGLRVTFTEFCTDTDGMIQNYQWAFGDGNTSSEQNPEHLYESAGDYTVRLTVRDDDGAESFAEKTVSVQIEQEQDGKKGGGGGSGCFIRQLQHDSNADDNQSPVAFIKEIFSN
jgi:PKD repeat protein